MLKTLENLQYGHETPKSYQYSVANQRIINIGLSNQVTLEKFHTGPVNALDLDKIDERYLISGAKDGALCIHDLLNETGKASYEAKLVCKVPRRSRYSHRYSINTVQWYPFDTGVFVSSGMDSQLKIWDTNRMKPVLGIDLKHKVHCHHMSPISTIHELIAVAMEYPHAVLVDPKSGTYCHELRAHKDFLPCIRWSPTSEYVLATGGVDGKILLWDVRAAKGYLSTLDQNNGEARGTNRDLLTAHSGVVNGMRFTDDGLYLVSVGTDCRLRLWDVALGTNTLVNYGLVINNNMFRQRAIEVCCSTNPPVLFVPSSNYILLFDLMSGNRIKTLVGHFSLVNCCLYRPVAHQLFSGANDNNILLWTPDTKQEILEQKDAVGTDDDDKTPQNSDNWSSEDE